MQLVQVAIHQRHAAGVGHRHRAVGVVGDVDIHVLGQRLQRRVALVEQPRRRLPEAGRRADLAVELIERLQRGVHGVDRVAEVAIRLQPQGFELVGQAGNLGGQGVRRVHEIAARRGEFRLVGIGLHAIEEGAHVAVERIVRSRRAEQVLDVLVVIVHRAERLGLRGLHDRCVLQVAVDLAGDVVDLHPVAHAADIHRRLVDLLARVAGRIHVGDVLRQDRQRFLVQLHRRDGIGECEAERHGGVTPSGSG